MRSNTSVRFVYREKQDGLFFVNSFNVFKNKLCGYQPLILLCAPFFISNWETTIIYELMIKGLK